MTGSVCAVKVCQNNRKSTKKFEKDIHYHCFPKEPIVRQKWIEQCGRSEPFNADTSQICSVHFSPEDYVRDLQSELLKTKPKHRLKPEAVPTLHLDVPVEWYPRTKVRRLKAPLITIIPPTKPKLEDEPEETIPKLNQIFLPEVDSINVKEEKDSEEKEIVMQQVTGRLEFDPLNSYDILLEKYNLLLTENSELKDNLGKCTAVIEKQKRKIKDLEKALRKVEKWKGESVSKDQL